MFTIVCTPVHTEITRCNVEWCVQVPHHTTFPHFRSSANAKQMVAYKSLPRAPVHPPPLARVIRASNGKAGLGLFPLNSYIPLSTTGWNYD